MTRLLLSDIPLARPSSTTLPRMGRRVDKQPKPIKQKPTEKLSTRLRTF